MSNLAIVPQSLDEAIRMAEMFSKAPMVPREYQGKPANTLVAIQWGLELGLKPLQSLQNIAVINGRPSMYGDALIALVRGNSVCHGIKEYFEGESDTYTAVCLASRYRPDGSIEEVKKEFSVTQAKRAKLWGKQGPWTQYPDRMLQMRARSLALRDAFPDVLSGMMTVEEAQDIPEPRNVTPEAAPLEPVAPPKIGEILNPEPKPEPEKEKGVLLHQLPEKKEEKSAFQEAIARAEENTEPAAQFVLSYLADKPDAVHTSELDWANEYNDLMLSIRGYEKATPAERRTKLKELEEKNAEALAQMPDDIQKEMKQKRMAYNKGLSIEEKEQANG